MAMGKRRQRARQSSMWVANADLPRSVGHPFYERLNRVLDEAGFDAFVEEQCAKFYADGVGRPSLAPGRYFRMLLLGYFEGPGVGAGDGVARSGFVEPAAVPRHRAARGSARPLDGLADTAPDRRRDARGGLHVGAAARGRRRLAQGADGRHRRDDAGSERGAAEHRSSGHGRRLRRVPARTGGGVRHPTPTRAELARLDRKRPKKGSNDDWTHPQDPDTKITKMKDGRTRLAHKAEHAVDLETGAVVGVTVQDANAGDTTTMVETLITAAEQVEAVVPAGGGLAEVVADKGYHSNETLVALTALGLRSYVSEPDRGRRRWRGTHAARDAVYANRRRIRRPRGRRLLRQRGERPERPHAHLYETGRLRRLHLRGHANIRKRLLVQACGLNLGLLMRRLTGVGTPRGLQGRVRALFDALQLVLSRFWRPVSRSEALLRRRPPGPSWTSSTTLSHQRLPFVRQGSPLPTGC